MIEYIYGLINDKQNDFENLERKKKTLVKYYQKCNKRIQSNLKIMNQTYGNRLDFVINAKEDILEELTLLFDRIERIEHSIESMTSDSMDKISECNENICGLYSALSELYDNIVSEIQVDIEMLEEDLGIEFDVKEKFKELLERHKKK